MLRAGFKLFLLIAWILLWFPPTWLAKAMNKTAWRDWCMQTCSAGILYLAGIRLKVSGKLSDARPLLVVSNHLSYFDIPLLASHAPVRFTPKSEIRRWPFVGTACYITDCVFVDRRPGKVKAGGESVRAMLARGEAVSLFPESTTGNGIHVLPFKSGFFSLAEEPIGHRELTIQPVAFTYTRIHHLPIDSTQWPLLAWYGDMSMLPHLWNVLKLSSIDAELAFLPPVTLRQFGNRKDLAAHCHRAISEHIRSIREKR